MKTVLTDRSLVNMTLTGDTDLGEIYDYVEAIHEAGAKFVEIDFSALKRLPKPKKDDNYIFRINERAELPIANLVPFAYVVLPLKMWYLVKRIKRRVILEINVGDVSIPALLKICRESINMELVDMVRLVGELDMEPAEFDRIVKFFRATFAQPLDICPTNNGLTALSACITAYAAKVDCLTLAFASQKYAALDEFLITLTTMYHVIYTPEFLSGICKATIYYSMISGTDGSTFFTLLRDNGGINRVNRTIDMEPKDMSKRRVALDEEQFKTVMMKKLESMGLDQEVYDTMFDIMKKTVPELGTVMESKNDADEYLH